MSAFSSVMRRFSRSSSLRKRDQQNPQSPTSYAHPNIISGPTTATGPNTGPGGGGSVRERALGGDYMVLPSTGPVVGTGIANEGRPISSATDASFDFANRPVTNSTTANTVTGGIGAGSGYPMTASQVPQTGVAGGSLSRTDQIVLKHFWESKYAENAKRDLHYLRFPFFPQYPGHRDLLPYCEIYHLVKTSPGANIISLGSANGVYIGFELQTGSQLHIDLDDDWFTSTSAHSITHNRVSFRNYQSMLTDPSSATIFKSWPKPLTIEFLEDQYREWCHDLMSICWEGKEIRELVAGGSGADDVDTEGGGDYHQENSTATGTGVGNRHAGVGVSTGSGSGTGNVTAALPSTSHGHGQANVSNRQSGVSSMIDDGYVSEKSAGHEI